METRGRNQLNKLTDVWEIKQEMKNPHPAPFPEALTDRIVYRCRLI